MSLLLNIINSPALANNLKLKDWELLIRQARAAQLLSSLTNLLHKNDVYSFAPPKAKQHLDSALVFSMKQKSNVLAECKRISEILWELDIKSVYLKGAAYSLIQLPLSDYRLLSDIDIMVDKSKLKASEKQLFNHGWFAELLSDYDDMYYRKWSHEIPPLKHIKRQTILDLHHNILPITTINSSIKQSTLYREIVAIDNSQHTFVLPPPIMLLHSAAHLFHESEYDKGLRDLLDIKEMFLLFTAKEDNYCHALVKHAKELGLERTLFYAMRYIKLILKCDVPNSLNVELSHYSPSKPVLYLMDFSFKHIFVPFHSSCHTRKFHIAETILYWRGHLLRMPLRLLVPHLMRKSYMRMKDYFTKDNEQGQLP